MRGGGSTYRNLLAAFAVAETWRWFRGLFRRRESDT